MVGLNFADPREADKFKEAVESKIQYVRRSSEIFTIHLIIHDHHPLSSHYSPIHLIAIKRSKPPDQTPRAKGMPPKAAPVVSRPPVAATTPSDPYSLGDNKKKPQAPQKGRKLTKADIGLPTDFK